MFICDCFAEIMVSLFLNCADTWCRGFDNIDLWRGSFGSHGNVMSNFWTMFYDERLSMVSMFFGFALK